MEWDRDKLELTRPMAKCERRALLAQDWALNMKILTEFIHLD